MFGYSSAFGDDIFDHFERLQRQMDQMFGDWRGASGLRSPAIGSFPAINVGASHERIDVYVFVPGVDADSLDISLQQNLLTIAGARRVETPDRTYRQERFTGDFHRVITLPEDVSNDNINASYRDGVLHVTLPRREAVQPLKITVH